VLKRKRKTVLVALESDLKNAKRDLASLPWDSDPQEIDDALSILKKTAKRLREVKKYLVE
jgi:hypothetical protein